MPVTPQHVQQYENEGYTLVRNLIPRDLIEQVRRRTHEVARGEHNWGPGAFQVLDPQRYTRPDGGTWPIGIQRPAKYDPVFKAVAEHANLAAAMKAILGGDAQLFTDQVGVKYAFIREKQGGQTFYHQDSYYWKIEPQLGANVWIPMDDVGDGAIALAIMPGSHRDWDLLPHESYYDDPPICGPDGKPFKRHRIPLDRVDFSREVLVPMSPGDGLFFTNFTWHRSEPNRTDRDLSFYAIAYRLTPEAARLRTAPAGAAS